MKLNPRYVAAWLVWAAIGVAIEVTALLDTEPGDTLSELVRTVLSSHPIIWYAAAGVAVWAFQHLWLNRP